MKDFRDAQYAGKHERMGDPLASGPSPAKCMKERDHGHGCGVALYEGKKRFTRLLDLDWSYRKGNLAGVKVHCSYQC